MKRAVRLVCGALLCFSLGAACGDSEEAEGSSGRGGRDAGAPDGGVAGRAGDASDAGRAGSGGTFAADAHSEADAPIDASDAAVEASDAAVDASATDGADGSTRADANAAADADVDAGRDATACASRSAKTLIPATFLSVAFDAGGSMGMPPASPAFQPWYDKALKWDPVVSAAKAFYADPASAVLAASLTIFPTTSATTRCSVAAYSTPNVTWTALPSAAFATALDGVASTLELRLATPTLAVLSGVYASARARRAAQPGRYAVLLLTDGYPDGCADNSLAALVSAVTAARSTDQIRTHVVVVANPPVTGAPAAPNLNTIAAAGGTQTMQTVSTGDPSSTATQLRAALGRVRQAEITCAAPIPDDPAGTPIDERALRVSTAGAGGSTALVYDPTCVRPNAWRYDNVATPTQIQLCPSTCNTAHGSQQRELYVEFLCEAVPDGG